MRFQYSLLAFDVTMIAFIVASSFFAETAMVQAIDVCLGIVVLCEFVVRIWASKDRRHAILSVATVADVIVAVSLLAPMLGESLAFLRIVRLLVALRSYRVLQRLRRDSQYFRKHERIVVAGVRLAFFIFLMTGIVYETQRYINPEIGNYVDALYFTVSTLTTTGYGDITLEGTWGRLLVVAIMIFGVSLFIAMVREVFRSPKLKWRCKACGLLQHDADAIHCKHCGETLKMPHEGS